MGNWNRRRLPRRKYYQDASESFHRPYYTEFESSGACQSNVPSWERQFCTLVGSVPWGKVVAAKKFLYCHNDIIKWNDSAGEEAFNNAKQRFWATINGLPCDIRLPDPDMYIDEIDWNPHIDPELILDLDREYFNPDEGVGKGVDTTNQNVTNSFSIRFVNPWEDIDLKGTEPLKDAALGWNQWDGAINESSNLNNVENPWEQCNARVNGTFKDIAWGSRADKSWGWNQGQACDEKSKYYDSLWGCGHQNVESAKEKGWGVARNGFRGWETNVQCRKFSSCDTTWGHSLNQHSGGGKDRQSGDFGNKNWGWNQWGNQNNEPNNLDSRRNVGVCGGLNTGYRKRDGFHQYSPRHKSSRIQDDDCCTGHQWRNGRVEGRRR